MEGSCLTGQSLQWAVVPVEEEEEEEGEEEEEESNIKFHENPYSGSQVVPCGRADGQADGQPDRHDEANSPSS
jgi:hypothetical protein